MWIDEQQVTNVACRIGEWLKPAFLWYMRKRDPVIADSGVWRFDLSTWAMKPLLVIKKPLWFTKIIMTLCTETKDVKPE